MGGVGQRRKPSRDLPLGGELRRLGDQAPDALTAQAPAAIVLEEVGVAIDREAGPSQAIEVPDELLDEVRAHLHLAHAGVGLRVRDAEVGAGGRVKAEVPDAQVAQLADADAGAAERCDDRPPPGVVRRPVDAESPQVELGNRLSLPRSQIARWESDGVEPPLSTVRRVLHACGFDLSLSLMAYEPDEDRDAHLRELHRLTPQERLRTMLDQAGEQ